MVVDLAIEDFFYYWLEGEKRVAERGCIKHFRGSGRHEHLLYERHLLLLITALFAKDETINVIKII